MIEITNIVDVKGYVDDFSVVIFDLDDTLYSEKDYVRSGFKLISQYFHIDDLEKDLWNSFIKNEKPIDVNLKKYNLLKYKEKALHIYRSQFPDIKCYPGVIDMLLELKIDKRLALITDGRVDGQQLKIASLGIGELFDKIIITDELGGIKFRKPNPTAFYIMSEFFDVDFKDMCYIGDNKNKDFVAPETLGMGTILFNNIDGLYK